MQPTTRTTPAREVLPVAETCLTPVDDDRERLDDVATRENGEIVIVGSVDVNQILSEGQCTWPGWTPTATSTSARATATRVTRD